MLLEETARRARPGHETTAVTDREYRSQCIRGHIACLETRFVSFPRPPTTYVHCDPLNNFNMAASTRPVPIYRRLSRPNTPGRPTLLASRCSQYPAAFSIRYVSRIRKNIRRGEFKRISNQEIRTDHFNTTIKIDVCSAFRQTIKSNSGPVRKKNQ